MIQPHYAVEALLRFKQQLNQRDKYYGMNTDHDFPPIPHFSNIHLTYRKFWSGFANKTSFSWLNTVFSALLLQSYLQHLKNMQK